MSQAEEGHAFQDMGNDPFESNEVAASSSHEPHERRSHSPSPTEALQSQVCPCGNCPVVTKALLYRGHGNEGIIRYERDQSAGVWVLNFSDRIDDPFVDCFEDDVRDIGRRIACEYHLNRFSALFEKVRTAFLDDDRGSNRCL